jgi:ketosteroid isomerase-like protein
VSTKIKTTREVVDEYYQAVNTGNWDAWLALFNETVKMDEQLAGHVVGAAILRGAVGGLKKGYSKFLMHPQKVVIDGEHAAVVWHCEAANAAGVPIDAIGANYFEVVGGYITYVRTIHDTVPFKPFTDQKL